MKKSLRTIAISRTNITKDEPMLSRKEIGGLNQWSKNNPLRKICKEGYYRYNRSGRGLLFERKEISNVGTENLAKQIAARKNKE